MGSLRIFAKILILTCTRIFPRSSQDPQNVLQRSLKDPHRWGSLAGLWGSSKILWGLWPGDLHPFWGLQPHLTSRLQSFETSGRVIQSGCHWLSFRTQPYSEGDGKMAFLISDRAQTWPAWSADLLTCCSSASNVGGIASVVLPFFAKRCFLASLTLPVVLVMSYIRMTNRSSEGRTSKMILWSGVLLSALKEAVTSGKSFHVSQAVTFPLPGRRKSGHIRLMHGMLLETQLSQYQGHVQYHVQRYTWCVFQLRTLTTVSLLQSYEKDKQL